MANMLSYLLVILETVSSALNSRRHLALENLALRQQLAMLKQSGTRPHVSFVDRMFWILFSISIDRWRTMLHVLHPDTVVRWHRRGFRCYWSWKSQPKRVGRPSIPEEIKQLIRGMSRENIGWGAPRIHGELLKLGINISQATVSKYLPHYRKPPSQTWRTFLANHADGMASMDFFTAPTATFRILYVFIVLSHDRRKIVHFNVTAHPTAQWTAQQLNEAFPYDSTPRFLIRDRDCIYGEKVQRRIKNLGIEEVVTAPRSPWQNPYAERVIGSIRRDCLNHVIVLSERQLRKILREYLNYYHGNRTHLSLLKDSPKPRPIESSNAGRISKFPQVGGLHHLYTRLAA